MLLPKFVRIPASFKNHLFPAVQVIAGKKVKVLGEIDTPRGPAYKVESSFGTTQIRVDFCVPCDITGRIVPII